MPHPFKNHIERIQNSDESTKKFWLYMYSGATMLFVIMLWGGYMNLSIPTVPGPEGAAVALGGATPAPQQQQLAAAVTEAPGPTTIFMAGLEEVLNGAGIRLSRGIASIKEVLFPSGRTITIDRVENHAPKVIMNGLEDLPQGQLPIAE